MSERLRVAVVGSGPAGFYAAGALLASDDPPVEVDLLQPGLPILDRPLRDLLQSLQQHLAVLDEAQSELVGAGRGAPRDDGGYANEAS